MACLRSSELEAFLLGSLSDEEWKRAREHLAGCEDCRRAIEPLAAGTDAPQPAGSEAVQPASPPPNLTLGPYRILREIGRGGQAQVYLAEDARLSRKVALKVLSAWFAGSAATLRRFEREAAALSRLDHPNICAVYEAGEVDGVPFIAMRHVEGETLASMIAAARTDAPPGRAEMLRFLTIVERAARALHFAHESGLIHRDVKPTNIMVTRDGEPVLLDFGLVREGDEASQALTRSGDIMGTPAYIPPEQLSGGEPLDRRADVYALGVTLYQCLTLELPFQATSREALYRKVVSEPPADPRRANPRIPHDLKVVIETALEKKRERRYATALEFAEDLRRVRDREPIRARPAGPILRTRKWAERNPVVAAAAAMVFLCLAIGLGVSLHSLARMKSEERAKDAAITALREERDAKDGALAETRRALRYADGLRLAALARSLAPSNPGQALLVALEAEEREPGLLARSAVLSALEGLREERTLAGHLSPVLEVEFSPDGTRIVTASADGTARVWDVETGRSLALLQGHQDVVSCISFSRDGKTVITGCRDGTVRVWWASTGSCRAALPLHEQEVLAIDVSPDGDRVATASWDGAVASWSLRSLQVNHLEGHAGAVGSVSFDRAGELLLTASHDGTARIWDAKRPRLLRVWRCPRGSIARAAWSPDGRWIVAGSGSSALVWEAASGTLTAVLEWHGFSFHPLAWSPDGRWLLTTGDRTAMAWETGSWKRAAMLEGHEGGIQALRFSADGSWLVTASDDRTARLWAVPSFRPAAVLGGHEHPLLSVSFSPDSNRLVTASGDATARIWRIAGPAAVLLLKGDGGAVTAAAYSPDGRFIATGSEDRAVRLWDAASGRILRRLGELGNEVITIQWAPGSGRLFARSNYDAKSWELPGGEKVFELGGQAGMPTSLSPQGDRVLVLTQERTAVIRDLQGGSLADPKGPDQGLTTAVFSPDGERVASGVGRKVRIWSARSGKTLLELEMGSHDLYPIFFSPDGRLLLVALDTEATVFDLQSGKALTVLSGWEGIHVEGSFSPDSRRLLIFSPHAERLARIWDPRTGRIEVLLKGHKDVIGQASWSRDGRLILTCSPDRTARVWDAATGRELLTIEHQHWVRCAAFSPDGRRILTGSVDGIARIWPLDPLPAARAAKPRELTPAERDQFEIGSPAERRLRASLRDAADLAEASVLFWKAAAGSVLPTRELAGWMAFLFEPRADRARAWARGASED